ncbi:MAG: ATP-dependent RecD-like DNA helicase [Myxococcales bacterium]|nr:MAG: ATP-dependent RecD-like DNA helicase [Myxococcales bacterium]
MSQSPTSSVVLHGHVRAVTYENDSTGYRVIRVDRSEGGVETVVGAMAKVYPDMEVRIVGRRVVDARYGPQVQAESVTVVTPTTVAGLERFLGSGFLRGIGPRLAARLVEHFGDETLKVLDDGGAKLSEVRGVSKRLATEVGKAWNDQKHATAVLLALHNHGISPALAGRIFRRYGGQTLEIVQSEPYRLAAEVIGVGFITADRIARSLGVAPDAPERMEAGIVHYLHTGVDFGNTWAPRGDLVERCARELGVEVAPVDEAIERVADAGQLVLEGPVGPEQRVFPANLHEAESLIAVLLARLLLEPGRPLYQVEEAIESFRSHAGIALAPAQRLAIEAVAAHKVLVITGGPGVGKTTIVRAVLELYRRAHMQTQLCAPTGRAAKRLGESTGQPAVTIHRLLEIDPRNGKFTRDHVNTLEGDAFVVDEASMLDVPLASALLSAIPSRARLLLVGDVDQLPSVGPGALLRDAIDSGRLPVVRLDTIFRQAEASLIIDNAHRIRRGVVPSPSRDDRGDFFMIYRPDPLKARELLLNLVTERIPARFGLDPARDIQVLAPMRKGEVGIEALNLELQAALNPPRGQPLRRGDRSYHVGDKVMQLKNDYGRDVYNGDIGFVVDVQVDERKLTVRIDDRDVEYDDEALDNLTLAYAVSIHKSQGSEYPAVVIPWLRQHFVMLSRNLLYTAVTRGKRLVVLVADPRAIEVGLAEERREDRRTSLAERLPPLLPPIT